MINKKLYYLEIIIGLCIILAASINIFPAAVSNVDVFVDPGPEQSWVIPPTSIVPPVVKPSVPPAQTPELGASTTPPEVVIKPEVPQKPVIEQISALPASLLDVAKKIPQLAGILAKLNITDSASALLLKDTSLIIPGFKKITGAENASLLNNEQKSKIPAEMIFVLFGNERISAMSKLSLTGDFTVKQKLDIVAGSDMTISIKTLEKVKSVTGVMKLTRINQENNSSKKNNFSFLQVVKAAENPILNQQALVLNFQEVEAGIYSAKIKAPLTQGEYDIVASIAYEDQNNLKEVSLTAVINPAGYVYEKVGDKELRINQAEVSLYYLNDTSLQAGNNSYEIWPAADFGQENAQLTDKTGSFSFIVPEGKYYLLVKADGYKPYQSDIFTAAEGKIINRNILLKKEFNFFTALDWNILAIAILFCLVIYNFYKDRKRAKEINRK